MAKRVKKRVRREYTKAEEKELRAHSKARTPVKKIAKLTKMHRKRTARESPQHAYCPRAPAIAGVAGFRRLSRRVISQVLDLNLQLILIGPPDI